jgi:hypothetical protein
MTGRGPEVIEDIWAELMGTALGSCRMQSEYVYKGIARGGKSQEHL